jgi:hypothetical protein
MDNPSQPPALSVVMPTYQCRHLMERHLAAMAEWADLAGEIIVVDSRSTDGTLDYVREMLRHPGLRIIERDRGLYASWNEGIAATSGHWIYISTAGETISRSQLLLMLGRGESAQADVVISPSDYVDESGRPTPKARKRPKIYAEFAAQGDVLIAPPAVRHFAFRSAGTHALLGSLASDLFRGDFLRARPFPENYGTHGDTAWLLRHAHEMSLCVLQATGSTFCLHAPTFSESKEARQRVLDLMHAQEIREGGLTPVLTSSIQLRSLMSQRKSAWSGWPTTLRWAAANLRYLRARHRHGKLESEERRGLAGHISRIF